MFGFRVKDLEGRMLVNVWVTGDLSRTDALEPGSYSVEVSGDDLAPASYQVHVRLGQETLLEAKLSRKRG